MPMRPPLGTGRCVISQVWYIFHDLDVNAFGSCAFLQSKKKNNSRFHMLENDAKKDLV
jgi:hypothetical protein